MIRIINYKFFVSDRLEQLHQGCDYLAVANVLAKNAANEVPRQPELAKIADSLQLAVAQLLQQYRN